MGTNNRWLHSQLGEIRGINLSDDYDPLIEVRFKEANYRICSPNEYVISRDVIEEMRQLGANVVAHEKEQDVTREAQLYAQSVGIEVLEYAKLFGRFRRR